jgi:hypothetical protein
VDPAKRAVAKIVRIIILIVVSGMSCAAPPSKRRPMAEITMARSEYYVARGSRSGEQFFWSRDALAQMFGNRGRALD